MKKLFLDFDGVIVNTIKCITDLYNEDFRSYKKFVPINWWEVSTWNFDELNCTTREYVDTYFNQPRFFKTIEYMPWARQIIDKLKDYYEIIIVSSGYSPNLVEKELWVKYNLPFCKFIGVNFKEYEDKAHVDMSDGIFIDDSVKNLVTSNASIKICFGDEYEWNKNWKGVRCANWCDVWTFFGQLKGE